MIIHTRNEAHNIRECILSARLLTSHIIVVDMESEDETIAVAAALGACVYSFPHKKYVEPSRAFGIKKADAVWTFILDADERITSELASEIREAIHHNTYTYYKVPRKNIFAGTKWLKHGGWYPDYQIRLIKKSAFVSWGGTIHSPPRTEGLCGILTNPLYHYFHPSLENMVAKTIVYEKIESDLLFHAGKKANTATFFRKFLGELYRRLIYHKGFLDGPLGVIESIYQAFSKTITYLFLYEKNRSA